MKRIFGFIGVLLLLMAIPLYARTIMISYSDEFKPTSQYNTGVYSEDNCAAASLYMVLNYMDINLGSVSDIRNKIKPYSGWLYTDEIEAFLLDNEVDYRLRYIRDENSIIEELNNGIVMLCLDASKISNKGYYGITGHFLIVTGYREDIRGKYFEVYDPMSYEVKYYKAEEVYLSAKDWWRYFFLFEKKIE